MRQSDASLHSTRGNAAYWFQSEQRARHRHIHIDHGAVGDWQSSRHLIADIIRGVGNPVDFRGCDGEFAIRQIVNAWNGFSA